MVGFYDLSDTDNDNDSAINEIISQAQDACVLDQLSAINFSGVTDSVLPTHLETRFRNLKSFPSTKPNTKLLSFSTLSLSNHQSSNFSPSKHNPDGQSPKFSPSKQNPHSQSPNFSPSKQNPRSESSNFSPSKQNPDTENPLREKTKHGSVSVSSPPFGSGSSPSSEESSMSSRFRPMKKESSKQNCNCGCSNSPSPPRRKGCLWFSPKKKKKEKKKSKEDWSDELLSELESFSFSRKEQEKVLKKAMKEEEKVSREAEKIVKWAKTASARMNLKDEFSDDE